MSSSAARSGRRHARCPKRVRNARTHASPRSRRRSGSQPSRPDEVLRRAHGQRLGGPEVLLRQARADVLRVGVVGEARGERVGLEPASGVRRVAQAESGRGRCCRTLTRDRRRSGARPGTSGATTTPAMPPAPPAALTPASPPTPPDGGRTEGACPMAPRHPAPTANVKTRAHDALTSRTCIRVNGRCGPFTSKRCVFSAQGLAALAPLRGTSDYTRHPPPPRDLRSRLAASRDVGGLHTLHPHHLATISVADQLAASRDDQAYTPCSHHLATFGRGANAASAWDVEPTRPAPNTSRPCGRGAAILRGLPAPGLHVRAVPRGGVRRRLVLRPFGRGAIGLRHGLRMADVEGRALVRIAVGAEPVGVELVTQPPPTSRAREPRPRRRAPPRAKASSTSRR